jgi:SWI/SNF-related matrix-associated actin-dependent regulator 1 of chromatin subfamily A
MQELGFDGRIWIWSGGFVTKDLPKAAGFRWDPNKKYWWTDSRDKAAKLAKYGAPEVRNDLESFAQKLKSNFEASWAEEAAIKVPCPKGLEFRPSQLAGIKYIAEHQNTLLGDEMGIGKTIEAIGAINYSGKIKKVLIVCPNQVKINWKRELEKWLVVPAKIELAYSADYPEDADIVIINYEACIKHQNKLRERKWDLLIADEAHYMKNENAQRTQSLLGRRAQPRKGIQELLPVQAKHKVFMTGTPMLNRPRELWTLVSALAPSLFGDNFFKFGLRYCGGYQNRFGWDFSGASHLEELQDKLRSNVMIRRLKKDVMKELPPKIRQVIELNQNGAASAVKQELATFQKHQDIIALLRADVELAKANDDDDAYTKAVEKLRYASNVAFNEMSAERHRVALAKVPDVIEHLESALEEHKVVCFAHHIDVINKIYDAFKGTAVKLTGEEGNLAKRQDSIDSFQTNPKTTLMICGIQLAQGITLTASPHAVFAELDWVPGIITQAEDRLHRWGQNDNVLIQHLVVDGSLDAKMAKTLIDKQEVADQALDDDIKMIAPVDTPATTRVTRKQLAVEPDLSVEVIQAVHQSLRILSGTCDGAVSIDSIGFNKVDTQIGKSLADTKSLTQKQAKLGKRIVKKYHRQLPEDLFKKMTEFLKGDKN